MWLALYLHCRRPSVGVEDSTKTDTSNRLRKAMDQITQLQADLTTEQGSTAQYKAIAQASEAALKDLQESMEQAAGTFKSQQEKADAEITMLREKVRCLDGCGKDRS